MHALDAVEERTRRVPPHVLVRAAAAQPLELLHHVIRPQQPREGQVLAQILQAGARVHLRDDVRFIVHKLDEAREDVGVLEQPLGVDRLLVESIRDEVAEDHEHHAVQLRLLLVEHLDHPRQCRRSLLEPLVAQLVAQRLCGRAVGVANPLRQAHHSFEAEVDDVVVQRLERLLDRFGRCVKGILRHDWWRVLVQMFQHLGEPSWAGVPQGGELARLQPCLITVPALLLFEHAPVLGRRSAVARGRSQRRYSFLRNYFSDHYLQG